MSYVSNCNNESLVPDVSLATLVGFSSNGEEGEEEDHLICYKQTIVTTIVLFLATKRRQRVRRKWDEMRGGWWGVEMLKINQERKGQCQSKDRRGWRWSCGRAGTSPVEHPIACRTGRSSSSWRERNIRGQKARQETTQWGTQHLWVSDQRSSLKPWRRSAFSSSSQLLLVVTQ